MCNNDPADASNVFLHCKKLLQRYNKKEVLITTHIKSLKRFPTFIDKTFKLRATLDRIERDFCTLEALEGSVETPF